MACVTALSAGKLNLAERTADPNRPGISMQTLSRFLPVNRPPDQPAVPLTGVRFLPPLEPPTVRDFAAFEEHVEGVAASVAGGTRC